MARNKFDVDERLETPFDFRHLKRVGVYIGKHKWKMLLALFLSALASVTSLAVPKITQTVMDVAVPQKNVDLLLKMALAFMGIIIVGIVFTVIRSRIMAFVSQQIIYDIRKDLFAHLQQLPFAYYDSRPAGKILVRVINYVNSVSIFFPTASSTRFWKSSISSSSSSTCIRPSRRWRRLLWRVCRFSWRLSSS